MLELRAETNSSERLFDYEPKDGTIIIVKKKRRYTIKLFEECKGKKYKVVKVAKQIK